MNTPLSNTHFMHGTRSLSEEQVCVLSMYMCVCVGTKCVWKAGVPSFVCGVGGKKSKALLIRMALKSRPFILCTDSTRHCEAPKFLRLPRMTSGRITGTFFSFLDSVVCWFNILKKGLHELSKWPVFCFVVETWLWLHQVKNSRGTESFRTMSHSRNLHLKGTLEYRL